MDCIVHGFAELDMTKALEVIFSAWNYEFDYVTCFVH